MTELLFARKLVMPRLSRLLSLKIEKLLLALVFGTFSPSKFLESVTYQRCGILCPDFGETSLFINLSLEYYEVINIVDPTLVRVDGNPFLGYNFHCSSWR